MPTASEIYSRYVSEADSVTARLRTIQASQKQEAVAIETVKQIILLRGNIAVVNQTIIDAYSGLKNR